MITVAIVEKTSTFMCIQLFFCSSSNNSIKHVNWMRNERAKHLAILCAQTLTFKLFSGRVLFSFCMFGYV